MEVDPYIVREIEKHGFLEKSKIYFGSDKQLLSKEMSSLYGVPFHANMKDRAKELVCDQFDCKHVTFPVHCPVELSIESTYPNSNLLYVINETWSS